jgi:hypothetical protein
MVTARIRRLARSTALRSWLAGGWLCALIAVQTFAVVHPLDLAAHTNGEACKICVGVAGLGSAAIGAVPVLAIDVATPEPVRAPLIPRASVEPVRQSARGPPSAS